MKRLYAIGFIITIVGLVGLTICLIHFIPAYILAEHTFPNDATWQPMVDWLFPIIGAGMFTILGIGTIAIAFQYSKEDKVNK
jgi:hypothetical protein